MADDHVASLLAELNEAAAVIEPQIRGMHDLAKFTPGEAAEDINGQTTARERRRSLMAAAVSALKALQADDYPELKPLTVSPAIMDELEAAQSDVEAAVSTFNPERAAALAINLGEAEPKPA